MKIRCKRNLSSFRATSYTVKYHHTKRTSPRLCAAATTRIFKLGRGAKLVDIIFTKRPPKNCVKFYEIVEYYRDHTGVLSHVKLVGYRGAFMAGVRPMLIEMYEDGYRYVRVERVK